MTIYTSRLLIIPNYDNHLQVNSSYSFQHEIYRSTLIVLPNPRTKRFIQGIKVQCGNFLNGQIFLNNHRFESISPVSTTSDVFSADESICECHSLMNRPVIGH